MLSLHDYQRDQKAGIYTEWGKGHRNVCAVLPTGGGKSVETASIVQEYQGASCVMAHRQELVSQLSLALARCGVRHALQAPDPVVRNIVRIHMDEVGRSFYEPTSRTKVAGVDTLIRMNPKEPWFGQVGLWVTDECHHLLRENKWGKAVDMFPNAFGLGFTATPIRADRKGLGRKADGVFDSMVIGPSMRELIYRGFLTEYEVWAPPSDLDLTNVPTAAGGDFSPEPLRKAVHKSHIVGDIVKHYLRIAPGKLGVTFAVDIEAATDIAKAYRAAGVPAEIVSSKTPDALRVSILRRFRNREILQLVNVDLFGEGFDLPAIEVVSMGRPTQSYGLYVQQFGRALRVLGGKLRGVIIDHVGNVLRHGLPDKPRVWTLERGQSRASGPNDAIPLRVCAWCTRPFERINLQCPYCKKAQPAPGAGAGILEVDGDLALLDPDTLAEMRGERARIDAAPAAGAMDVVGYSIRANHIERQARQAELRHVMLEWQRRWAAVEDLQVSQRRFFHRFGVDILTAQTLKPKDAVELRQLIESDL